MSMLEQLVGQLWFIDRRSADHQAAVAKDLAVGLPYNNRWHDAMSALGINDTSDYFSVRLHGWDVSPAFSREVSMPRGIVRSPRSKMQARCLQIEMNT